jgi:hypothetical protein
MTIDLQHTVEVLEKNEAMLMKRVKKMVDSTYKYTVEEKIRGLRVAIRLVKNAIEELDRAE